MYGYAPVLVTISALFSLSTAATSSICADQAVFDSCLGTTKGMITAYCTSTTDYNCLCQRWTAHATCYNSCPNDPGKAAAYSTRDTYCSNAAVYTSSSSSAFSAAATTSAVTGTATSTTGTTAGVDAAAVRTASSSAAAAAKSNAAVKQGQAMGSLVIALGGVAMLV